jgi:hypothetical protein
MHSMWMRLLSRKRARDESDDAETEEADVAPPLSIESAVYIGQRKGAIRAWWERHVSTSVAASPSVRPHTFESDCTIGAAVLFVRNVGTLSLARFEDALEAAPACLTDVEFHMPDEFENEHNPAGYVALHFDARAPAARCHHAHRRAPRVGVPLAERYGARACCGRRRPRCAVHLAAERCRDH